MNAQNNSGTDLDGVTGTAANPLYIFNEPTAVAGSAANMSVVMTDPNQIAAAGAGSGTGDNSNAVAMAKLAEEPLGGPTTSFSLTQNLDSATPVNGTTTGNVQVYDTLGNKLSGHSDLYPGGCQHVGLLGCASRIGLYLRSVNAGNGNHDV